MPEINGVVVPDSYNGIGLHDSPGCENGQMTYVEATNHAKILLEHGFTLYKLFVGSDMKVERCRAYVDAGITVIVRFWTPEPWGRKGWVTSAEQMAKYADVGAILFEPGWNEFNISEEWKNKKIPNSPQKIAEAVIGAWYVGLNSGMPILFPSNTPGGAVDHRLCYDAIANLILKEGLVDTIKHVAIHNRPHNNEPDSVWTENNTVTFDEWNWVKKRFNDIGADPYFWATEHGTSVNDDQNHTKPQVTLDMWTKWNWEWFARMNPSHPKATGEKMAGLLYWIEDGYGKPGWEKDRIIGSNVPEMPNPSPLWTMMGERNKELAFSRYGEIPGETEFVDAKLRESIREIAREIDSWIL
jgi:hypothetical protein